MATATKRSRASKQLAERPAHVHAGAAMEFLIFEDNSGSYHWMILAGDGSHLGGQATMPPTTMPNARHSGSTTVPRQRGWSPAGAGQPRSSLAPSTMQRTTT